MRAMVQKQCAFLCVAFLLQACGFVTSKLDVQTAGGSFLTSVTAFSPLVAKPEDIVTITGRNFFVSKTLKARVVLADGSFKDVPLSILSRSAASFIMPEGAGLGLRSVKIIQGVSTEIGTLNLIANQTDNDLPLWTGEASDICNSRSYIDINGEKQTGTKNCGGALAQACLSEADSNCIVDGASYKPVSTANLVPGHIKSGVTIAGVPGSLAPSPLGCSTDGAGSCVVDGTTFRAAKMSNFDSTRILNGSTVAGVVGNLTLPPPAKVLIGTTYGANGTSSSGTLTLPSASNVLSGSGPYGETGDLQTPSLANRGPWDLTVSFPGAGYYSGTANSPAGETIVDGTTILGVVGLATLKPADCSNNGLTGCVTTATYKSADLSNLSPGNIKAGVTLAGTLGAFPSANYLLAGSSGTDLTSANFNAQIKSSATFQYFGADGVRYTGAGDSDIIGANIRDDVDIFGESGSVTQPVVPDPWDVRIGKIINGVAGKLKPTCRNRVNSARFNYDGSISSIGQAAVTTGTTADIWDTIDDYNNNTSGLPASVVSAWGSDTDCGGIESTAGDANVWKDVTTASSGAPSNCATDSARCTMQDKITGLWWSKSQSTAAWDAAWANCQNLDHNGVTGWRLPTQKELMEAYIHGIRSAVSTNWITQASLNSWYWTGSSNSASSGNGWGVGLATGYTYNTSITCGVNAYATKNTTNAYVCVR